MCDKVVWLSGNVYNHLKTEKGLLGTIFSFNYFFCKNRGKYITALAYCIICVCV